MFSRSRTEICKMIQDSLQGPDGKYSSAKIVLMFGFLAVTVFIWKLLVLGTLTIDYFIWYMLFISGHNNISKFLDNRHKEKEVE